MDDIKPEDLDEDIIDRLACVVEFAEDFETGYDDGTIYFGHVQVFTNPDYDEDEEDDE